MREIQDLSATYNGRRSGQSTPTCYSPSLVQVLDSGAISADAIGLGGDTADWVIDAAKKLEKLGRRQADWDSYGGLPLKQGIRNFTLVVLHWLRKDDLPVPGVVLGSAGTVQLEWRSKCKELEVELRDNNSIEFVMVSPDGGIKEGEATSNVSAKLRDLSLWLRR
jgi:hypothetical protein